MEIDAPTTPSTAIVPVIPADNNEVPTSEEQSNKRRRKKSIVWEHFTIETVGAGCMRACCKQCKKSFAYITGSKLAGTSHLKRHIALGICPVSRQKNEQSSLTPGAKTDPPKKRYRASPGWPGVPVDQDRCTHEIAKMIIQHDYPLHIVEHPGFVDFIRTLQPQYNMVSFNTIQGECVSLYLREKQNLLNLISGVPGRVSLTVDLGTSNQSIGYAFVTGHFVDEDWNLHRRLLNVVMLPFPDSDYAFNQAVVSCLSDWNLEGKLFTLTLDQSFSNETMISNLRGLLSVRNPFLLNAQLLRGNCYARVLSRLAQDALGSMGDTVRRIRESVKYVKTSDAHDEKFTELRQQLQVPSTKELIIDDQTKWNTTYQMLVAACELKEVFACLDTSDPVYKINPSVEDWKQVEVLCSYLKLLFDAANVLADPGYQPANVFYHEVSKVQLELTHAAMSPDPFVSNLTKPLKEKFDKYWKECFLALAVAVVMDPRFKMKLVEFSFSRIFGDEAGMWIKIVDDGIHELFEEYFMPHLPLQSTFVEGQNMMHDGLGDPHDGHTGSQDVPMQDVHSQEVCVQMMNSHEPPPEVAFQEMHSHEVSLQEMHHQQFDPQGMPSHEVPSQEMHTSEAPHQEMDTQEAPPQEMDTREASPQEMETREAPAQDMETKEAPPGEVDSQEPPPQEMDTQEPPPQEMDTQGAPPQETNDQEATPEEAEEVHTQETQPPEVKEEEAPSLELKDQEAISQDVHGQEEVPQEINGREEAPREMNGQEEATQEINSQEEVPQEMNSQEEAPQEMNSQEEAPQEMSSREEAPQEMNSQEEDPQEMSSREEAPKEMNSQEEAPQGLNSQEAAPQDINSQEATPQDINSQEAASQDTKGQEAAPQEVDSQEAVPHEAGSEGMHPNEEVSKEMHIQEVPPQQMDEQETATQEMNSQEVALQETHPHKAASEEMHIQEVAHQQMDTQEAAPQEMYTQEAVPEEMHFQEASHQEIHLQEATSQDVHAQEVHTQEYLPQEMQSQEYHHELHTQEVTTAEMHNEEALHRDMQTQVLSQEVQHQGLTEEMKHEDMHNQDLPLLTIGDGLSDFDVYISEITSGQHMKSELDQYLEESLLPRVQEFDLLGWWKLNKLKYPILSKMAADILSMPVSTVAPESVFDTENKKIDNYKTSLRPVTLEALACAKDWLRFGSSSSLSPQEISNALVKMEY